MHKHLFFFASQGHERNHRSQINFLPSACAAATWGITEAENQPKRGKMMLEERRKGEQRNFNVAVSVSLAACQRKAITITAPLTLSLSLSLLCVSLQHTGGWYVQCIRARLACALQGVWEVLYMQDVCFPLKGWKQIKHCLDTMKRPLRKWQCSLGLYWCWTRT